MEISMNIQNEAFLDRLSPSVIARAREFAVARGAVRFYLGTTGTGKYPNLQLDYPGGRTEAIFGRTFKPYRSSYRFGRRNLIGPFEVADQTAL
jgi:hypothetical protein